MSQINSEIKSISQETENKKAVIKEYKQQYAELKKLSKNMISNKRKLITDKAKTIEDLEEQIRDLMFYVDVKRKIANGEFDDNERVVYRQN